MATAASRPTRKVWDLFVRIAHWSLVASIAAAWFTRKGGGAWHEWAGYASLLVIALRIAWGWAGPHYARFSQFMRPASATFSYARHVLTHSEPRYLGHNPLGGWMILALLVSVALTGLTGWLYTTNRFWGEEWLENFHHAFALLVLVLAALHLAGVVVTSFRHRENLAAAMLHGRKRAPAVDDIA